MMEMWLAATVVLIEFAGPSPLGLLGTEPEGTIGVLCNVTSASQHDHLLFEKKQLYFALSQGQKYLASLFVDETASSKYLCSKIPNQPHQCV